MTKHELVREIMEELDILDAKEFYSEGSTITSVALQAILNSLVHKGLIDKQDLALTILSALNIRYCKKYNSSGSTITQPCLEAIHDAILSRV